MILDIDVANDASLIDDKSGAFRDAAHDEVGLRQELVVSDAVGFRDVVFVIAEERKGDAFFFGPSGLSKRIVSGDAEDFRIEGFIF